MSKLFTPYQLGPITLRNRVVRSAAFENMARGNAPTQELQDYTDRYGSETYGFTAYILNKVRIYSIPFCFIGIAIGAIYQYVIGIRKLDVRDKGFNLLIAFVTILIICQILPLIFAIVVKGWRG